MAKMVGRTRRQGSSSLNVGIFKSSEIQKFLPNARVVKNQGKEIVKDKVRVFQENLVSPLDNDEMLSFLCDPDTECKSSLDLRRTNQEVLGVKQVN